MRLINPEKYSDLRLTLRKLRKPLSLNEYLNQSLLLALVVGIVVAAALFLFSFLLHLPSLFMYLPFFLAPLSSYLVWRIMLWYPWSAVKGREVKIDLMLPSAVSFMYALSKGGLTVAEIFRMLSQEREDYGEVAVEAASFVRELDYLGYDPVTALRNLASTTPSQKFRRLIEFLIPVVQTGANLADYFAQKCKELYEAAEVDQKRYLDTLAFYAEFYVILMLFAPLVLIVTLMAVMAFYGASMMILYILGYLLIPLGSIFFIVLLSMKGFGVIGSRKVERKKYFRKVRPRNQIEKSMLRRLLPAETMPEILLHPMRVFKTQPHQVMFFSGGAASLFLFSFFPHINLTTLFYAFLILVVPFIIFHEIWSRKLSQLVEYLPEFLHSFASAASAGVPPAHAIKLVPARELGPLREDVQRMVKYINWGDSSVEAVHKVERECGNNYLSRTMAVVRRACLAKGEIADVLQVLATDATQLRALKRERWAAMFSYALIVYISFAVFLFCMVMLTRFQSLGQLATTTPTTTKLGMTAPVYQVKTTTPSVVWHATMLQAFFSGLIAGQFSTGRLFSGLKHSVIMMTVAFVVLNFFA